MPSQYEELSREALLEITPPKTVGGLVSESTDADGVITMRFECLQAGYPGWQWNVSLAHVDGYDPTVIEAELLPDAGALLSPDWVPWSERLAEYKAAQEAAGLPAEDVLDGDATEPDDDDDVDDEDDDIDEDGLDFGEGDDMSDRHGLADDGPEDDEAQAIQDEIEEYGAEDTEDDENL